MPLSGIPPTDPEAPPLRALLEEGFCLLALLRNGAWPPDLPAFQARLEALLNAFERKAQAAGKTPEAITQAKYAFCALTDELLLGGDSPLRETWGRAPLQLSLFGEHLAGEGFFTRLDRLREDLASHGETLEVFHACLLHGFQGKYQQEAPDQRLGLIHRLGQDLARVRGPGPGFAPQARPGFRFTAGSRGAIPLPAFWLGLGAAALALFFLFSHRLRSRTLAVAAAATKTTPCPPLETRPCPVPPANSW